MPSRPPSACPRPGCPHFVPCPDHTPKPWASSKHKGSTRSSRKVRLTVLRRDPVCVLCNERPSTEADHYPVPAHQGGLYVQSNLRGVCHECHQGVTQRQAAEGKRR